MTVSRPSGKMIRVSPPFTALISVRVASGRVGSSGIALVSARNGFTHQALAMPWSMAKTGSWSRSERASGASRKETWLRATIAFGPAFSTFSRPRTSSR
ncbi:hypothetical protein AEGHOMDF_6025 [Methylobacterium soli]|nr:hypothetical protein AEGHOMDF_6025 [Methylobacterium soli]